MTKKSGTNLPVKLMAAAAGSVGATDAHATGETTPQTDFEACAPDRKACVHRDNAYVHFHRTPYSVEDEKMEYFDCFFTKSLLSHFPDCPPMNL